MGKSRFIWEQIMDDPDIYRISEVGSRQNCYLVASKGEMLVIDPRSKEMLRNVHRLSRSFNVQRGMYRIFLTGIPDEGLMEVLREMPSERTIYSAVLPQPACQNTDDPDEELTLIQVRDGDVIRVGDYSLKCITAEGCRRGLMALWSPEKKILFAGAVVGCDYLPKVENWDEKMDVLGLQIETLRRFRRLQVRCVLPGTGAYAGVDNAGAADIAAVLDEMLVRYCVQILEVYQKVPAEGSIEEEKLLDPRPAEPKHVGPERSSLDAASCRMESCLKYLLYRKYIKRKEAAPEQYVYERGSLSLTDWGVL